MIIELNDELQQEEQLLAYMKQAGELCLKNEGLDFDDESTEVSLSFVTPEEIRQINRDYREKDAVTDVLSFPQYNSREEILQEPYVCLGDVIICPGRAREQAEEYGHSYTREMVYLMVHSMLHLLGYDHMEEEEKAVMRAREEAVMNEMGILR
ncbi:MAG: rRNA maturation RNase YbeY [Firmicutes bacterium]|jgi:probable rRNA maturation factor|nr:rRNA maturation RNase YbeY [Bacillota bacterium]